MYNIKIVEFNLIQVDYLPQIYRGNIFTRKLFRVHIYLYIYIHMYK